MAGGSHDGVGKSYSGMGITFPRFFSGGITSWGYILLHLPKMIDARGQQCPPAASRHL